MGIHSLNFRGCQNNEVMVRTREIFDLCVAGWSFEVQTTTPCHCSKMVSGKLLHSSFQRNCGGRWVDSGVDSGWIFLGMAFLEQQGQGSRGKTLLRLPDLGHVTLVKWIYCMGAHRETLWRCCSQHSPTKTCLKLSSKKHLRMSLLECRWGSYWCSKTVEECTCQFWSCCLRAFTFQARNLKFLDILQTSLDILPLYPPMISRSKGAGRCKKRPWKIQSWLRINHRRMVGCLGA